MNSSTQVKFHIGLISTSKHDEDQLRQALVDSGYGGYIHTAKSLVEMNQKLSVQKIQLLAVVVSQAESDKQSLALIQFFKQKKDYHKLPIFLVAENSNLVFSNLIQDKITRCFPIASGFFVALMTMLPLAISSANYNESQFSLTSDWLQNELVSSAKSILGQNLNLTPLPANDDDLHQPFLAQINQEVRSHLGWYKMTLRLLNEKTDSLHTILGASSPEEIELLGEKVLEKIAINLSQKIQQDLESKGAFFYDELEKFSSSDRKLLISQAKHSGFVLRSDQLSLLLELSQYV